MAYKCVQTSLIETQLKMWSTAEFFSYNTTSNTCKPVLDIAYQISINFVNTTLVTNRLINRLITQLSFWLITRTNIDTKMIYLDLIAITICQFFVIHVSIYRNNSSSSFHQNNFQLFLLDPRPHEPRNCARDLRIPKTSLTELYRCPALLYTNADLDLSWLGLFVVSGHVLA